MKFFAFKIDLNVWDDFLHLLLKNLDLLFDEFGSLCFSNIMIFQTKLHSMGVTTETFSVQVISRLHESFKQSQDELDQWPLFQLFKRIVFVFNVKGCLLFEESSITSV